MASTNNIVHVLTLLVLTTSMFTVTMANKDWPSFGNFNYTDWWSRFGNHHHQINKTEQQPKKIIVGGSQNWHFGYNYSDWAIKNGPFYLNDTLGKFLLTNLYMLEKSLFYRFNICTLLSNKL